MAYYNGFPATYQNPYYQQPQQPQAVVQQQNPIMQNTGIIWVQGEAGAKSYLVAPNTTVQLWDSEAQVIYLKSADASGMPSMKVIDYTIRGSEMPQSDFLTNSNKFILRDEFNNLKSDLDALKNELNELKHKETE